jgi:hypothetical protein
MSLLATAGVDKPRVPDFVHLRIGHSLSRMELAMLDIDQIQQTLESNSDGLFG